MSPDILAHSTRLWQLAHRLGWVSTQCKPETLESPWWSCWRNLLLSPGAGGGLQGWHSEHQCEPPSYIPHTEGPAWQ